MLDRGLPEAAEPHLWVERRQARSGLRRVGWVRVTLLAHGASCELVGTGHRRPAAHRITLSAAASLIASGVPSVVLRRHESGAPADQLLPARDSAQALEA